MSSSPGKRGMSHEDARSGRSEPPKLPTVSGRFRITTGIPLLVGAMLWVAAGNEMHWLRWVVLLVAAGLAAVPAVNRRVGESLERLRGTTPAGRMRLALFVWAIASAYLVLTAFSQGRDLFPKTEDDCSYLIGMQILARGRLWMAAHPLGDFFESFYILVRPVYCSIYFPGTALMFVPTVWLHAPTWLLPAIVSGAAVALLYRISTELMDGVAGLLAALLLVSLGWFRTYSILLMSQGPMLLLGLLMFWSFLRWRQTRRWVWPLAFGVFAGWAAITRPPDALAYAVPIGIAMLVMKQRSDQAAGAAAPRWFDRSLGLRARCVVLMIAGAVPFLALQIVFDLGVTGRPLYTPYAYYLNQDQPGTGYGLHRYDATLQPASTLPQKQAYYEWCKPYLMNHQPGNFWGRWLHSETVSSGSRRPAYATMIVDTTLPSRLLLVLATAGLLGLSDRRQLALALTLPLFVLIYLFNPFFLEHYALAVAPAMILGVLMGVETVARAAGRYYHAMRTVLTVGVLLLAVTSLWELKQFMPSAGQPVGDETFKSDALTGLAQVFPPQMQKPAVVLVRYAAGENFFAEPVYNTDVAWPDDAPIIKAHDLGDRDAEIINYYGQKQPERMFYLFERKTLTMTPLGTAGALHDSLQEGKPIQSLLHPQR